MKVKLRIATPMPYFAELPYYLWGEVNYDSEGDCKRPTDQQWTWLEIENRESNEYVSIERTDSEATVSGDSAELVSRAAHFLADRSQGQFPESESALSLGEWDHGRAMARTERVVAEFADPRLKPFDSHLFWGSWKWVGLFSSDFTWVGRWIMDSVLRSDSRAVNLCATWLQEGTVHEDQSAALRYALRRLTELEHETDAEWVRWYFEDEGATRYPEPDFQAWKDELWQTDQVTSHG